MLCNVKGWFPFLAEAFLLKGVHLMKMKTAGIAVLSVFCMFCGWLIVDAVVHHPQQTKQLIGKVVPLAAELNETETPADTSVERGEEVITAAPVVYPQLSATNTRQQLITLGALYDEIERSSD